MAKNAPTHRVSTLQDWELVKPLEVEETMGYLVKKATEKKVPSTTLDTCYRLVSGINYTLGR
jgi:ketopantoate reductase